MAPQGEAQRKDKKKNVVRVTVDFNRATEQPLIDKLGEVGKGNRAKYIKDLIRRDLDGE